MDPLYTDGGHTPQRAPLWTQLGWQICADVHWESGPEAVRSALECGANAIRLEGEGIGAAALEGLLAEVPLKQTALFCEFAGPEFCSRVKDHAARQGVPPRALRGALGTAGMASPSQALALTRAAEPTSLRTLCVDTSRYHNTAVEELGAATVATSALLDRLTEQGMDADDVARRLYYHVLVDTSYLPAIAKLRALRHLVTLVLQAHGAAEAPVFVHATVSDRSHSWLDPATSTVRCSSQAMSAILGGCDALSMPLVDTRLLAHMQLLLQHEAHLDKVADPGTGAYYIEHFTDALGARAWAMAQDIQCAGGLRAAKAKGLIGPDTQGRQDLEDVARGQRLLVGVNRYPAPAQAAAPPSPRPGEGVFRLATPFEDLRLHVEKLTVDWGRRPRAYLESGDSTPKDLHALAVRVTKIAGFDLASDWTNAIDVHIVPGAVRSTLGNSAARVTMTLTDSPDGSDHNLYPGCNMVDVLQRIISELRRAR